MDNFKPKAGEPLHKPREGSVVGYLGAEGSCIRAQADFAVVELRAELADLIADLLLLRTQREIHDPVLRFRSHDCNGFGASDSVLLPAPAAC